MQPKATLASWELSKFASDQCLDIHNIKVQKIEGLLAQSLDETKSVNLPKVYSRESIPARRNQITSVQTAEKWPQLERFTRKIPPILN